MFCSAYLPISQLVLAILVFVAFVISDCAFCSKGAMNQQTIIVKSDALLKMYAFLIKIDNNKKT